jgi:hypothetical protein
MEECTYFWGVNTSWGINMAESKRPLNQEDNQAPQPTIATITNMTERGTTQERLAQLMELEEDMIMIGFHQEVHKEKDKSWHDIHIKNKNLKEGDLVLLYDNKYLQHPGKFMMHWLGLHEIKSVTYGGVVQL